MPHLRGPAAAIRGLVPAVHESFELTRQTVLEDGLVDRSTKELCYRYLAGALDTTDLGQFEVRERAALEWAAAIAFDSARADDDLWARLHAQFSEPELVDLGCAIGFELGQQHWRRTIGLPAREDAPSPD